MQRTALIACVGNSLVADDAAGCAVYARLAGEPLPEGVRLELLSCGGLVLLDRLRGEDLLIVVDAVQFGAEPGTIHVADAGGPQSRAVVAVSAHGIGVREALEVGKVLFPDAMPGRALLVGIEGCCFNAVGAPMTAAVAGAIPRAASEVLRILSAEEPS